ncbi:BLOC-1 COMPLEX SUBUNIT 1 [Salix purpurea]|uniref:Biogenesis of lysosome-related organelles complex 1 subunit 1 n=1 Tax=Salix purpurea TaxID=77065 RepID=A0A9Q0WBY0_SALPP|nr:BLOC-1 COMPLEX SUBUNIT 1 [Salix purpurea]
MSLHQRTSARRRGPLSPECEKPLQPNAAGNDLESSLLQIFTDHHRTSLRLRETTVIETEKAKKEAVRVADLLVDEVNGGVQESFVNEKRIEMEIRGLAASIVRFMKQSDQWLTATHSINTAIKVCLSLNYSLLFLNYRDFKFMIELWIKEFKYDFAIKEGEGPCPC